MKTATMSPEQFNAELSSCRTELEVRRLVHWHWPEVVGTSEQVMDCLRRADAKAVQLAGVEEGVPVVAIAA